MRVAPKVLVIVRDAAGYGAALADALRPTAGLTRESAPLELPLAKYGLDGEKASGELVNFSDSSGTPQVSFFVLPDYKPPVAACAMNEILALVSSEAQSTEPALIVPFITRSSNYYHGGKTGQLVTLHGAEIGATTEFTQMLVDGTTKHPQSLQIRSEPILCLMEMVCVLNIPTVLVVASVGQHQSKSTSDADLEVLQRVGDHLARHINLEFNKEAVLERGIEKSPVFQEPWRELYR
uniref:DUF7894 domain-containing protein n=1 Tax=Leersia perrieri TaxID=77586 RepID=A0A0D9VHM2_9ORYZ